jgi:hypothetical protein
VVQFDAMERRQATHAVALAALVALVGCGGAPPPTEKLAASEAAIRGASEVGAEKVPQAALHLKLAQEQIAAAKALIADEENERAELVLMRAQADAELALALARESSAQADAQATIDQVKKLRAGTK